MVSNLIKNGIRKSLSLVGVEIRRKAASTSAVHDAPLRNSLVGVLRQAKNLGFSPATVIDVGAAFGWFAEECHSVFPDAKYMLVEPLEEYKPYLDAVIKDQAENAEYILAAAANETSEITINVHPDLVGSSLYYEGEVSNVNGVPRIVPCITLDSLVKDNKLKPPFLLKIDTQGAELDVLSGYEEHLQETEFILLEVSLFKFFEGGPQLYDVVTYMKSKGFVTYDLYGFLYRPLDNALAQIDMVFVKEAGWLRQHHFYATPEQRAEQFKYQYPPAEEIT